MGGLFMRITNNMLINNMIGYINNNLGRMEKYQYQYATGKKILVPSDDPVVAARALKLRTDVAEVEQYKRNVQDATSWLELTEDALASIGDILQRARELAVDAANGGVKTPDDLKKIKEEIQQLKGQIVHIGNSTYSGRYIFSGYKTDKKLLNEDGTFAIDVDTDREIINFEIGIGDDINVNVLGGDLFNNGGDATAGTAGKLIEDFNKYIAALDAGDYDAVSSIINDIDDDLETVLRIRAEVGARVNRLKLTDNRLDADNLNFTKLMSLNEDVDLAEIAIKIKSEENVYRASLAVGARIITPSLVDFLR